jgi:HYR domain
MRAARLTMPVATAARRRVATLLLSSVLVVAGLAWPTGAEATTPGQTVLTFDEIGADLPLNQGYTIPLNEQYAGLGVHFTGALLMFTTDNWHSPNTSGLSDYSSGPPWGPVGIAFDQAQPVVGAWMNGSAGITLFITCYDAQGATVGESPHMVGDASFHYLSVTADGIRSCALQSADNGGGWAFDDVTFGTPVSDTAAPVVSVPANQTALATSPNGAVVTYPAPTANDDVDGTITPTCDHSSGELFPIGMTTVTCTATDAAGNTGSGSFTVTVTVMSDTTAPSLTLPPNQTAEATSSSGAVVIYPAATATDDVDGTITPTCVPASGSTFALGTTTVTCTATDAAGNTATGSFTVTVVDSTAPVLSGLANRTATATSTSGAVVTYPAPTATDAVDGAVTPVCNHASGETFPLGTTTVTCTATDAAGNPASGSFTVTVTYAWSGIRQPVNADGSSVFKLGSTVPVKFALTGISGPITNATATLTYRKITSGIEGTVIEAVSTAKATSGNLFRYDTASKQYIFNWSTKGLTKGTYQLTINLGDGVTHTVLLSLK